MKKKLSFLLLACATNMFVLPNLLAQTNNIAAVDQTSLIINADFENGDMKLEEYFNGVIPLNGQMKTQ